MLTLNKISETSSTITLGWTPPATVDVYVFYAKGVMVSFAGRTNKDGTARTSVKFSKTTPGPPFDVVAVCHHPYLLEVGVYPATPPPPPPPSGIVTGTHWAEPPDYAKLKGIGYGFAVTNVAPADQAGAKAKLDAAKAAGIKLVIGMYAFGGPEPYVYNASSDTFTLTSAATSMLNYLKSRESEIIAFFGFNEPYWVGADGHTDPCGVYSAASLRDLRNKIKAVWPNAKVYHDIGWPSEWAPGGDLYNAHSCIGNKYADQTGVADYVGVWDYPFENDGYKKQRCVDRLNKETAFVLNKMQPAKVMWLGQSHSIPAYNLAWPTTAQLADWNQTMRSLLPAGSLISWYVWQQSIYTDYLANHPEQWSVTV